MKKLLILSLMAFSLKTFAQPVPVMRASYTAEKRKSPDGKLTYMVYSNDPLQSRWYVLPNGLTVILSVNKQSPRVQTLIATKAGSKNDPADNTGLAHYLEHLLFKGTDKYGTLDYAKEKVYLDQIDALYEKYNQEKDEAKRKAIYAEIDSVSGMAAKYSIANEYDKMMQVLGAQGTNAFTSFEQTVYVNDIPANQLDKWLSIEAERFRNPVLRLFHTELEAVYEEKNISLDNDNRKANEALLAELFKNHNYGKQTTIGTVEHLKNPSLKKIRDYFYTNYVPNNMAIILAGDFDPDKMAATIADKFAYMKPGTVPKYEFGAEYPSAQPRVIEITGPDAEFVQFAYRMPGAGTNDAMLLELTDLILSNSTAGLIDLNLNTAQKVLSSSCSPWILKDYSLHFFTGKPKSGQTLEEVKDLLLAQIEKVKKGEFDMDLIQSIILNKKVDDIRNFEGNDGRAYTLLEAFVTGTNYMEDLQKSDKMRMVTKQQIMDFANEYYTGDYVIINKRTGKAGDVVKIEKPHITEVELNRDKTSPFVDEIVKTPNAPLQPVFIDYAKDIKQTKTAKGIPVYTVKNSENDLFSMYYILDMGSYHDKKLALAVNYLKFIGTNKYTTDQIKTEFYKLACNFGVSTGPKQSYVYLNGLQMNFEKALTLFEELLADAKPDDAQLTQLIERTMKGRADAKLNKRQILWGPLNNYAVYGKNNPSNDILSETELKATKGADLTTYIHNLTSYPHKIYYYGPAAESDLVATLNKLHKMPAKMLPVPPEKKFVKQVSEKPIIYFVHYEMVQAEIIWNYRSNEYKASEVPIITFFNEYFGGGMSSVVFQTIRESKALAYSTYSAYNTASEKGEYNGVMAYVGTQADKIQDAMTGMNELLQEIPQNESAFQNARDAVKANIETNRILKEQILFNMDAAQKRGLNYDIRKDTYAACDKITLAQLSEFHKAKFSGNPYTIAILGSKDKIDLTALAKYGEVKVLTLEEIFGY